MTAQPLNPDALRLEAASGGLASYPPVEKWDDWVEYDTAQWPRKVEKHCQIIPTICFNCEAACGLLGFVEKDTHRIRRFEGNPEHPGSRGRNCAKGPATLNQVTDPERIRYPLKRVGKTRRRKMGTRRPGTKFSTISPRECAKRFKKSGATRSCITSAGPGHELLYHQRILHSWGIDGHNSHTNVCSAGARAGYAFWSGIDRPSPDHANARFILLLSSHLETGHYFNPHAQRIIEAKNGGTKICVIDTRLSNTASKADYWLSSWPGSEGGDSLGDVQYPSAGRSLRSRVRAANGSIGRIICARSIADKPQTFPSFISVLKAALRAIHAGVRRQRSRHRCQSDRRSCA